MEIIKENLSRIKVPAPGDKVFKDECFYSFDSPESPTGLYVCLNRWLGVGEKFLTRYSNRTDNKVFLRIKRTRKEAKEEQEGVPEKVSRLAINMEGGFQTDQGFEWEEECKVVVLPNMETFDITNPDLPMGVNLAVAGIRTAVSANKQAAIDAAQGTWDGEALVNSKHAENLQQVQNPPKVPPTGWKCEFCDLTSNLWINLTDGNIACGRKFFDGSGGNNHAVDHYKNGGGGGPLAVKLGTITMDGKADVFSYEEDEMVLDPYLEKHLAHFGIKIASCEKTDKSMVEMEIDMNQRIGEWAILTESGSKLVPLFGPGRTGLHNLGNTCYMNSVLQVLNTIPEFVTCYGKNDWLDRGDLTDPGSDLNLQLAKLCQGLNSGVYSKEGEEAVLSDEGSQPGIRPVMLRQLVGKGHPEFSSNRQQDSQELFLYLLELMERAHKKTNSQAPITCLQFMAEDRTECTASGQVRYKQRLEEYLPLNVPVEAATNVAEVSEYLARKAEVEAKGERLVGEDLVRAKIPAVSLVEAFLREEMVEDFYSSAIKAKTTAKKTIRMATFPNYLLVQLLKFRVDENWQPVKLDVEIDMPDQLDLTSLRGKGLQGGEVSLPEDQVQEQVVVNIDENIVAQLVDMGFAREGCRRAVFNTGSSGVEAAMGWVMDHMEDPDFSSPFTPGGAKSGGAKKCTAGEEVIAMVMSMGFSREQAEMALRNTDNNVERAIEWIFSHPDGEPESVGGGQDQGGASGAGVSDGDARYELSAFISHMGSSSHSGHYVCHIKDAEGRWVIFNDNKVAVSMKPPKELGYLYMYKRIGL
eukprot:GFUD01017868.1.p1 GENE.GFUD01017868.1~~GFUD01017868.1.p1  ORF type:complete len:808 (-),score=284.71 GFUD01017868.1:1858-4281(-)